MIDMSRRIKKEMTRGSVIFISVWLGIFALAFILWAVLLGAVGSLLSEYESVQPFYEAEEVFNEYFLNADSATIAGYDEYKLSQYDKDGSVAAYLESVIRGKQFTYVPVLSSSSDVKTYIVKADGTQFATFTLVKSEEVTESLGLSQWKLGNIDIKISPACGVNVFAPKNAVVKVNGVILTDEYREGDYVELKEEVYFPEDDADSRLMANYFIDGLFVEPSVTVENADGSVVYGLEFDKKNSAYSAEYAYRVLLADAYNQKVLQEEEQKRQEEEQKRQEEEQKRKEEEEKLKREEEERQKISDEIKALYGDFVYDTVTLYARYTHITNEENNKTAWDVLKYFKSGTPLYTFIRDYYNYSAYIPDNYEYNDVNMHHFAWDNDAKTSFTCIFEMNLVMTVNGADGKPINKVTEPFCFMVYVDISGKAPLIAALENSDGAQ